MPEIRAIVFDLDDTLYPYGAFVRSGFRAVSRHLAAAYGLPRGPLLGVLRRTSTSGGRGHELQAVCWRFGLPVAAVPGLVTIIREHTPTLRLPAPSRRMLSALRAGWAIGILTNGEPRIQRRKIAALGLDRLVDQVVYAQETAPGGKPAPDAFAAVLARLQAVPQRSVFVGDDRAADIAGAANVGMKTIHVLAHHQAAACATSGCGGHVTKLDAVPRLADALVPVRM